MKIGLVTPSWPGGDTANGITTAVVHLAGGLENIGHSVAILPIEHCDAPDPRVVNLPAGRSWSLFEKLSGKFGRDIASRPIMVERIAGAAEQAMHQHGIEVLVMEETYGWAGPVQRGLPIPVVVALHGPWLILHQALSTSGVPSAQDLRRQADEGDSMTGCAGVIAPSRDVLERIRAAYGLTGIPDAVIPNAIPKVGALNYDALDDMSQRKLLFVGRFDSLKGADVVIDAFYRLIRSGTQADLTIVGPDHGLILPDGRRQHIAEVMAALPLEVRTRITYKGLCSKAEISRLRQQHAVAIIASRYENFPYTLLESLSAGVATIATAVGGIPEIIRDSETGLLVPPNDPAKMAAACQLLLNDRALCRRLGAAARDDVARRFAPDRIARQTATFLDHVLREYRK